MMPGAWVTRVAHALLHQDTFELMVEPAVADLQFEPSAAAYVAAWATVAGAWSQDFAGDARLVLDDIAMLAALIGIQASYYSGLLLLVVTGRNGKEAFQMIARGDRPEIVIALTLIVALSALPTLLCFWPPRRVREPLD